MAKGREIKLPLPAAADLFSTQEERDEAKREFIADIPLEEISDFPDHPYKVKQDESMLELAASIREKGVVNPALVRPKPEGGYEMVAGHRRKFASELAGKTVMPCIVRNLTDDEATIIMVDSNLQREKVLPSEKAFAYKMKLDAMKRQAGRPSKNSATVLPNYGGKSSRQLLAEEVGESHEQIRKYIRLEMVISGNSFMSFPSMSYTEPGIYTYTIEQIAGLNPLCAYDPSVYHLKVSVTNAQDGSGLTAMVALRSEDADEKLAEAMFTNRYGTSPVPRDSNPPKTGDESNILLYGYLALVSIAGLVVSVVIQKRGKRRSS